VAITAAENELLAAVDTHWMLPDSFTS
jgi:hypothetical protein